MAEVRLTDIRKSYGSLEVIKGLISRFLRGIRRLRRSLRLRQVHAASDDRGAGGHLLR